MNDKEQKIVTWAKERVGNPYLYGGTGKPCTLAYRQQIANQYPDSAALIEQHCPRMSSGRGTCSGCKWYDATKGQGKECYDCATFVRHGANAAGITMVSGATSQWRKTKWESTGEIATLPRNRVCFVYRWDGTCMQHTGIYCGDGNVIDARGTAYGVVHGTLESYKKKWTHWGIPAGLSSATNTQKKVNKNMENMKEAVVIGGTLMLRLNPNKLASVVARMPKGSIVQVGEEEGEWRPVVYNGKEGYAMCQYLMEMDGETMKDYATQAEEENADDSEKSYPIVIYCRSEKERENMLLYLRNAVKR